jgi:hypothetical protein
VQKQKKRKRERGEGRERESDERKKERREEEERKLSPSFFMMLVLQDLARSTHFILMSCSPGKYKKPSLCDYFFVSP